MQDSQQTFKLQRCGPDESCAAAKGVARARKKEERGDERERRGREGERERERERESV